MQIAPRLIRVCMVVAFITLMLSGADNLTAQPVKWLPDSSGLLIDQGNEITLYNVAKKARRTTVRTTDEGRVGYCLSPDGKRIAVPVYAPGKDREGSTVTIVVHDLDGMEVQRSKPFSFPAPDSDAEPPSSGTIFWSPVGDKLVVLGKKCTGMYDLKKDHLRVVDNVTPFSLSDTPIRPDGTGFLGVVSDGNVEQSTLVLVDWDGWENRFKMPLKTGPSMTDPGAAIRSRWSGPTCLLHIASIPVVEVDTNKRTTEINLPNLKRVQEVKDQKLFDQHRFPDTELLLRTLTKGEDKYRLEIAKPADDRVKAILPEAHGVPVFSSSPDGKLVAVVLGKANRQEIRIIDSTGQVVDEIQVLRPEIVRGVGPAPKPVKPHDLVLGTVKVAATKADGKAWDIGGGAPDPEVSIHNVTLGTRWMSTIALDTHNFTYNLIANKVSVGEKLEIVVMDKDIADDDPIGRTTVTITAKHLTDGQVQLGFGQVISLDLKFLKR